MGSEGTQRSHEEAWTDALATYPPPPAKDAQSSPSMSLLLHVAMSEPLLHGMYPWVSMDQLSVSQSDTWEGWGREPFPAMSVAPDAYLVLAHPVCEGRIALETNDPAEAATLMARLVRDRLTEQTPGPHGWSVEVERVLRDAGWYPGRNTDPAPWHEQLEADGFHIHPAAEQFLREFAGLTVDHGGPGITRAREPFELDPLLALGEADRFSEWSEETGRHLYPLGELDHGHAFLGLDEQGELYVVANWLARFGRMPQAMENLILGVMPIRMPHPADS